MGSLAFDEYGRPFIVLRDQEAQTRLSGNDAIKVFHRSMDTKNGIIDIQRNKIV